MPVNPFWSGPGTEGLALSSDFHRRTSPPPGWAKTRASMEPRWSSWQMKGLSVGTNGPAGEEAKADPMQWVKGLTPFSTAVK